MASSSEGQTEKRKSFIKLYRSRFDRCMLVFLNVQSDEQLLLKQCFHQSLIFKKLDAFICFDGPDRAA